MMGWYLLLLLAVCCTRKPAETVKRESCLVKVRLDFNERADRECPADQDWDSCPARPAIMADMKVAQEKCRQ